MSPAQPLPDPASAALADLDVSDPRLYATDAWRPHFARLRAEDPVHFTPDSPFGPYWSVTRFDDIMAVDTNHRVFSSEPFIIIGDVVEELPLESFINMDPPRHDLQRRAVQPVVAPRNLAQFEGLIRARVREILDGLPDDEPFDWVGRVSINLTTQMLATLFDFPFEERQKLTYWSDIAVATPELTGGCCTQDERVNGLRECAERFTTLWYERKANPTGGFDLISLLQANDDTADMVERPAEYLGNLLLLIVGGNDTTRNSITGGVLALNQNPGEYDKLRADPGLIPSMVSEIIRWQTPLMHMRRTATEDVEFGGKSIRAGDKVVMWYLSGNRDESAIDRADDFVIDRANPRHHLSFGFGIHRCMGNRLAEMQIRILWEEILARFHHVEVVDEPVRVQSNFVRGYSAMPVRVHRH
jgi:cytochrome P450